VRAVVLVPRRADPERDRIWEWVRRYWEVQVGLPIFEGWHYAQEGPFNRSAAVNRASAAAGDWDMAVIIDGDVVLDHRQVTGAIDKALRTGGPVLGYRERDQLTKQGTPSVLALDPATVDLRHAPRLWRRWVRGRLRGSCSSCYVVTRDLWEAAGGFDERFVGWGWEDVAFRVATETLAEQELFKIPGVLFHIWHTVSSGNQPASVTMAANGVRAARYKEARFDLEAMRAILAETHGWQEGDLDAVG
jgi:hypothetical protein